ncbi:ROK family protein [Candidatus Woesearchaeota archaeon]|nr:ROK family protein [Candidatus Woesearchaeota archaeon]
MAKYIGVDVGGTKIEGALVNERLKVFKRARTATEAGRSRNRILENIARVVRELETKDVKGIGIGAPGFSDRKGKQRLTPNIKQFENFRLKKALEERLNRRIHLENDGNCFVLAEQKAGAAKGMKNVLGLTLGTGIGGGAIVDGMLLEGKNKGAAHFGHMIIDATGIKCHCGHNGDLESWCGGRYIEKRYRLMSGKSISAKEIFESKNKAAKKIVSDFYQKLGIAIADLVNAFNPECIVLGGSISKNVDLKKLRKEVVKYGQASLTREAKIAKNKLGEAGVLGAACLAIR